MIHNLEEGKFLYQKAQKNLRAPGENRTHDPPSSSSDALTTELLKALWRAGSKLNCNYTSHRGLALSDNQGPVARSMVSVNQRLIP